MKQNLVVGIVGIVGIIAFACILNLRAADGSGLGQYEYTTIRWGGRDNTHVILPNGQVDFAGPQLKNIARPDHVDDRSFYMNIVMNGLARDGWETVAMTSDDIIMRRTRR